MSISLAIQACADSEIDHLREENRLLRSQVRSLDKQLANSQLENRRLVGKVKDMVERSDNSRNRNDGDLVHGN